VCGGLTMRGIMDLLQEMYNGSINLYLRDSKDPRKDIREVVLSKNVCSQ
jgi:hypothetical protein